MQLVASLQGQVRQGMEVEVSQKLVWGEAGCSFCMKGRARWEGGHGAPSVVSELVFVTDASDYSPPRS